MTTTNDQEGAIDLKLTLGELKKFERYFEDIKNKQNEALNSLNDAKAEKEKIDREIKLAENTLKITNDNVEKSTALLLENNGILDAQNEKRKELQQEITGLLATKDRLIKESEDLKDTMVKYQADETAKINDALDVKQQELEAIHQEIAKNTEIATKKAYELMIVERNFHDSKVKVTEIEKVIANLETTKINKVNEISLIDAEISAKSERNSTLEKQTEDLYLEISQIESKIESLTDTQNALIKEIKDIEVEKKKVTAEYEVVKIKLFSITERETKLDAREAFIKDKYEQAGIQYR